MKSMRGTVHGMAMALGIIATGCGGETDSDVRSPLAGFTFTPTAPLANQSVVFSDASTNAPSSWSWTFGDGGTSSAQNPTHAYAETGTFTVTLSVSNSIGSSSTTQSVIVTPSAALTPYTIVGTNITRFYDNSGEITAPAVGATYCGQDAFHPGNVPSYTNNGDGTITDNVTGLMWVQSRGSKVTWNDALTGAATNRTGGYADWRMPTIKELYSLIEFSGINGPDNMVTTGFVPFIDTNYFGFAYGSGVGTERVIDCQDWSATAYVSTTMNGDATIFGVNFADGRIKGYPLYEPSSNGTIGHTLYARYVRNNTNYGKNAFVDNGDGTIRDVATQLMWSQEDSKTGLSWPEALAWVQSRNAANHLGHNDWRLPDAKELQSIVDYTRSPSTTGSPAIDISHFITTVIANEAGQPDYPYFWTSSVLLDGGPTPSGIYLSFGRAIGYVNGSWIDVHGAGSQKSDLMTGNPANYPVGRGPQGDAVRIYNYVRLVRDL